MSGSKVFLLAPPSGANVGAFAAWASSPGQRAAWLGASLGGVTRAAVGPGDTLLIPPGWAHAVATPADAVALGGNFLLPNAWHLRVHVAVAETEAALGVPQEARFPGFNAAMWEAAAEVAANGCLVAPDSECGCHAGGEAAAVAVAGACCGGGAAARSPPSAAAAARARATAAALLRWLRPRPHACPPHIDCGAVLARLAALCAAAPPPDARGACDDATVEADDAERRLLAAAGLGCAGAAAAAALRGGQSGVDRANGCPQEARECGVPLLLLRAQPPPAAAPGRGAGAGGRGGRAAVRPCDRWARVTAVAVAPESPHMLVVRRWREAGGAGDAGALADGDAAEAGEGEEEVVDVLSRTFAPVVGAPPVERAPAAASACDALPGASAVGRRLWLRWPGDAAVDAHSLWFPARVTEFAPPPSPDHDGGARGADALWRLRFETDGSGRPAAATTPPPRPTRAAACVSVSSVATGAWGGWHALRSWPRGDVCFAQPPAWVSPFVDDAAAPPPGAIASAAETAKRRRRARRARRAPAPRKLPPHKHTPPAAAAAPRAPPFPAAGASSSPFASSSDDDTSSDTSSHGQTDDNDAAAAAAAAARAVARAAARAVARVAAPAAHAPVALAGRASADDGGDDGGSDTPIPPPLPRSVRRRMRRARLQAEAAAAFELGRTARRGAMYRPPPPPPPPSAADAAAAAAAAGAMPLLPSVVAGRLALKRPRPQPAPGGGGGGTGGARPPAHALHGCAPRAPAPAPHPLSAPGGAPCAPPAVHTLWASPQLRPFLPAPAPGAAAAPVSWADALKAVLFHASARGLRAPAAQGGRVKPDARVAALLAPPPGSRADAGAAAHARAQQQQRGVSVAELGAAVKAHLAATEGAWDAAAAAVAAADATALAQLRQEHAAPPSLPKPPPPSPPPPPPPTSLHTSMPPPALSAQPPEPSWRPASLPLASLPRQSHCQYAFEAQPMASQQRAWAGLAPQEAAAPLQPPLVVPLSPPHPPQQSSGATWDEWDDDATEWHLGASSAPPLVQQGPLSFARPPGPPPPLAVVSQTQQFATPQWRSSELGHPLYAPAPPPYAAYCNPQLPLQPPPQPPHQLEQQMALPAWLTQGHYQLYPTFPPLPPPPPPQQQPPAWLVAVPPEPYQLQEEVLRIQQMERQWKLHQQQQQNVLQQRW